MVFPKDYGVGAEEEVEDAEEDGREETEVEHHGLQGEELEGANARPEDRLGDRAFEFLDRRDVPVVAGLLAETAGFVAEDDGVVGFGDQEGDEGELDAGPDEEEVEGPAPGGVLVYGAADERAEGRADEGGAGENHHGVGEVGFVEHVAYGAAGDGEEGGGEEAVEEAGDEDGREVLRHGAGDDPDEHHHVRADVYRSSAVEF